MLGFGKKKTNNPTQPAPQQANMGNPILQNGNFNPSGQQNPNQGFDPNMLQVNSQPQMTAPVNGPTPVQPGPFDPSYPAGLNNDFNNYQQSQQNVNYNSVPSVNDNNMQANSNSSQAQAMPAGAPQQSHSGEVEMILAEMKNGKTFVLENYTFGYDASKLSAGTPFYEEGPTGQVFGDEGGIREFLSDQSPENLQAILKQFQPAPAPLVENPFPVSQPANLNQVVETPAPAVTVTQNPQPQPTLAADPFASTEEPIDRQKLASFVEMYEAMGEAYKLVKKYLQG